MIRWLAMDTTTITCPSCDISICIVLKEPLACDLDEVLPLDMVGRDYDISELLVVNRAMAEKIKRLEAKTDMLMGLWGKNMEGERECG